MAVGGDIDVRDVLAAVKRLERAADRRLTMAMQQIAEEVVVEAKTNHAYRDRTGRLTQSIRAERVQGSFATGLSVGITAGGMRVTYAAHVEFGTRPHIIRARRRQALRFIAGGSTVFRKSVRHPGTRPYAFMANALRAKTQRAGEMIDLAMELAVKDAGL